MSVAARSRITGTFSASLDAAAAADGTGADCSVLPGGLVPGGHPSLSHAGVGPATDDRHRIAIRR